MKNKLTAFALFGGLFIATLNAQTKGTVQKSNFCGTESPDQNWEDNLQKFISMKAQESNKTQAVITIPVIVHLVHGGEPVGTYPNLNQGQIHSQIQVLNEDFGGIGYNSGGYPASAFANWAVTKGISANSIDGLGRVKIANCNIQFCLATKDTLGNVLPEPGIDRRNYNTFTVTSSSVNKNPASYATNPSFKNYMDNTVKPQTIWNVTKYLNIWVTDVNLAGTNLLGYATFPFLPSAQASSLSISQGSSGSSTKDGFWCYAQAFGSSAIYPGGVYNSGNDRGRTATHEIGHWVGLRHVWGDNGNCNGTDFCNDTPKSMGGTNSVNGANFGCPQYPLYAGMCNDAGVSNVDGDIFMNFMDYVDDPCKYMFTQDQANRVATVMTYGYYRKFLGTHNLCSVEQIASSAKFTMPAAVCGNSAVVTLNNSSQGVPVPSFTWAATGGATFSPNINSHAAVVSFPSNGTYTVTLSTNNGTASAMTKVINVVPFPTVLISTPAYTVCQGSTITFTATGANFYGWQPSSKTGSVVNYVASTSGVFTCVATGSASCKTTETVSVEVVECFVGLDGQSASSELQVYPNPMRDKLTLSALNVSLAGSSMSIVITDITGKVVLKENGQVSKEKPGIEIDTKNIEPGIYLLKVRSDLGRERLVKLIKE